MIRIFFATLWLVTLLSPVHAAQWDYPKAGVEVTNAEQALAYLQQHYTNRGDFRLRYQNQSAQGRHYNFDVLLNGEYQPQKTIVLSTNNQQQVSRIFLSLNNTIIAAGKPIIAAELEAPRSLIAQAPPALTSGTLTSVSATVFDPDLRTQQQQSLDGDTWKTLQDYPRLAEYLSRTVNVLRAGEHYYLSNQRVTQVDVEALLGQDQQGNPSRDSSVFSKPEGVVRFSDAAELSALTLDQPAFAQVMAFYHLNHSLAYLESLGFSLYQQPLRYDARGLFANNSAYYYGPEFIALGVGGVTADALDGDVILHELGHGIHSQIVPDWAYGHSGAIGEGVGDYWAGSYSYRQQYLDSSRRGQEFELDRVFNWDGVFGIRNRTRSLNNQNARYIEQAEYRAHVSVAGELGDELWSTPLFQSLKQAVQRYGQGDDQIFREFDRIVLQSMYGLGRGLKMHDLAESTVYTARQLHADKAYGDILEANFRRHGLIKDPFVVRYQQKYLAPNQAAQLRLAVNGRNAAVNGRWSLANVNKEISSDDLSSIDLQLKPDNSTECGGAINSTISIDYQHQPHLRTLNWRQQQQLVNGIPELDLSGVTDNVFLPDASENNLGHSVSSNKILIKTLEDRSAVIDSSFAVYLNIEHKSFSDLEVTLTSPRGTRINLLNHQPSLKDGFDGYFTYQHDEALAALAGQPSWGTWRLEITDKHNGNSGLLKQWAVGHFDAYRCQTGNNKPDAETSSSGGGAFLWLITLLLVLVPIRHRLPVTNAIKGKIK